MKRLAIVAALSALALTSCGGASTAKPGTEPGRTTLKDSDVYYGDLLESKVKLVDGRKVTCVVFDGGHAGGLSCDWVSAATPSPTATTTPTDTPTTVEIP